VDLGYENSKLPKKLVIPVSNETEEYPIGPRFIKLKLILVRFTSFHFLWSPSVIEQTNIFSSCGFFFILYSFFFSLPNLSGRRLDVYHTSTYGVAVV